MTSPASTQRALRELTRHHSMNLEATWTPNTSFGSPGGVSPDEQVIRLRGRHIFVRSPEKINSNDSPKKGQNMQLLLRSPKKTPKKSPSKNAGSPVRCSPRKRLHQNSPDYSPSQSSPRKTMKMSQRRIQWHLPEPSEIHSILPALSQPQLVELIKKIISSHPEMEQVIRKIIPPPDLSALEKRLESLKSNIYVSFPKSRWGSMRDELCFHRVSTHINIFKRECIEMGRKLVETEEWLTVIEYVLMTWQHVNDLPDWENPGHNKAKQQCLRLLAAQCMKALQNGHFKQNQYEEIAQRLKELKSNKDLETCMNFIEKSQKKIVH